MQILTKNISSISDLKKNPMQVLNDAGGEAVAILNHNKPAFYIVPTNAYQQIQQNTVPQWHLDKLKELENLDLEFYNFDSVMKELDEIK